MTRYYVTLDVTHNIDKKEEFRLNLESEKLSLVCSLHSKRNETFYVIPRKTTLDEIGLFNYRIKMKLK